MSNLNKRAVRSVAPKRLRRSALASAISVSLGLLQLPTEAATITVNASCSLINAIKAANLDQVIGACTAGSGSDILDLSSNIYYLTVLSGAGSFLGNGDNNGLPSITSNITIEGHGASISRFDVEDFRLFHIGTSGNLTLNDVTLKEGSASDPGASNGDGNRGGAIFNRGTLTLNNSTLSGNHADIEGGAIINRGTLTLNNSMVLNNSADDSGGAISNEGTLTLLNHSTISGNTAQSGGGLHSDTASITLNDSTVSGNNATAGNGGGIHLSFGTLKLYDTSVSGNSASGKGGGLYQHTAVLISKGSTVSGNSAEGDGGGVFAKISNTMWLTNSTISGNEGNIGGGLVNAERSNVNILNSTISGNHARTSSGGIFAYSFSGNHPSISFINSIIAGNTSAGTATEIGGLFADFSSNQSNLFGDSSHSSTQAFVNFIPGATDIDASSDGNQPTPLPAILGILNDNGGLTDTHLLVANSPAVDAADQGLCLSNGINLDQRGIPRNDGNCDIGAFEQKTKTITVNGSSCNLIHAITAANTNMLSGSCAAGADVDTLVLENGSMHSLTAGNYAGDGNNNGLPSITTAIIIQGNGATIKRDSGAAFRLFHIAESGNLTLERVTLTGGHAVTSAGTFSGHGGAIFNRGALTLSDTTVSDNSAGGSGGAIRNKSATASLSHSTVSNNNADFGGGIDSSGSTVSLNDTTVSNNSAINNGAGLRSITTTTTLSNSSVSGNMSNSGGGFYNWSSNVLLSNTTVSGNLAATNGGGLKNSSSTLTLINSTVTGNSAGSQGAGLYNKNTTALLSNSIIANSLGSGDCYNKLTTFSGTNNNWFGDNSCDGSIDGDPHLGPLASNGGPTQTHALLTGSGAIDAGDDAICAADPVNNLDQRGQVRPFGTQCDIGAFEAADDSRFFSVPLSNGKTVIFSL